MCESKMRRRRAGHAILALALIPTLALAHASTAYAKTGDEQPTTVEKAAKSSKAASEKTHHVYFRPFCRRSRHVTSLSAPCYD
jgi:hypothetical protein